MPKDGSYPDPFLTASIYCSGRIDAVLYKVVRPAWQTFNALSEDDQQSPYLWMMRYARGGEHLKVRVHGPAELRPHVERLLDESSARFFAALPPPDEGEHRRSRMDAPPIDADDETDSDHPDRTLRWTVYRRSPVSLAGEPYISDDAYVALFTRCLGAGCELVLTLEPDPAGQLSHRSRQTTVLKALIAALTELGNDVELAGAYLAYHRDWLLRYLKAKSNADLARVHDNSDVLERFDSRLMEMEQVVSALSSLTEKHWSAAPEERPRDGWRQAVSQLAEYVSRFRDDSAYQVDPFAVDPIFSPFFKVFHGLANQVGLNMAEEAFTHHLLLRALVGRSEPVPTAVTDI